MLTGWVLLIKASGLDSVDFLSPSEPFSTISFAARYESSSLYASTSTRQNHSRDTRPYARTLTSSTERDQELEVRLGFSFGKYLLGSNHIHRDGFLAHYVLDVYQFPTLCIIAGIYLAVGITHQAQIKAQADQRCVRGSRCRK